MGNLFHSLSYLQFTVSQLLPSAVSQLHPLLLATARLLLHSATSRSTLSLLITYSGHIQLRQHFIPFPVALCYQRCPLLRHRGGGGRSVDWPVTVAATVFRCCYVTADGGGGVLRSADTSHYLIYLFRQLTVLTKFSFGTWGTDRILVLIPHRSCTLYNSFLLLLWHAQFRTPATSLYYIQHPITYKLYLLNCWYDLLTHGKFCL
jgi:hypothetical protein